MKIPTRWFALAAFLSCAATHGATKVAAGPNGQPWIVTADGAIHSYDGAAWHPEAPPGTADDLALCGNFVAILTPPNAQGQRTVRSRNVYDSSWADVPWGFKVAIKQVACDGFAPVILAAPPDFGVYRWDAATRSWTQIHDAATEISVMNGRLFFVYPTTTTGNVWSRNITGGPYQRWGTTLVAVHIAGDANGVPWVATGAASNPLYKWDSTYRKWTFGFGAGRVYGMDIDSYVKMYILSEPATGGGYTVWSHDLSGGGWIRYSLPSY